MDRYLVPRLGLALVAGLAVVLIGVIVLRSPNTHGNLWESTPPDYVRTDVATVGGQELARNRPGALAFRLADVALGSGTALDPGRRLFVGAECSTCHGLDARGAAVGPALAAANPDIVRHMVRDGPKGMPAYSAAQLSDADLDRIAAYLQGLSIEAKDSEEVAAIQRMTFDPSVSRQQLLRGRVALRQSCGACHAQPSKDDIRAAFASDFDAASLVAQMTRQTNLSLEDARAIAQYMLAIRNGVDPLDEP
jgi:mono/diheme cytochrome c family protein